MHRVTVMGNADLSPTPFRPYATWLDEEPEVRNHMIIIYAVVQSYFYATLIGGFQDEEGGRRDIPNPFGSGAWDASYSGIHWQGGSRMRTNRASAADENARH